MKSFYPTLLLLSLLLVAGCNDTPVVVESPATAKRAFTLSASMPGSDGPDTRVTARQLPDSLDIALKWQVGNTIQLYFKSEDAKVPLFFKQENVNPDSPGQSVSFKHLGALQVVTLKNMVNKKITLENPSLDFTGGKWYHDAVLYPGS